MKTIICDIDGTIFEYVKNGHHDVIHKEPVLLPGVAEKFKVWEFKAVELFS